MPDLGPLDDILGLRVRLAHGAIQRHFAEHSDGLGLTQKQISVLWLTGDAPGIAQIDLARRLQMDRATTMAIVHQLEARGLISRGRSAQDARRIDLHLSPAGEAALTDAKAAIAAHEKWLRSHYSAAEIATLKTLLARIGD